MTLPDGKAMTFTRGVTGGEIAAAIGPEPSQGGADHHGQWSGI